jgi:transcriptional regulator with XRE-family HTH domain
MDEVRRDAGLNVDEFADALGRDSRQVGKWLKGTERPQFETVFAVERFQQPLVLALAKRVRTIEITTQLTARRSA